MHFTAVRRQHSVMRHRTFWILPALVLGPVLAMAGLVVDAAADDPADVQWPPKPFAGLQYPAPAEQPAPMPSLSPLSPPGAISTLSSAGAVKPASASDPLALDRPTAEDVPVPGQPVQPFQMPNGDVIGRDGILTIYDAAAPLPDWSFSADVLFLDRSIGTNNRLGGVYSYNTHSFIEHLNSSDAGFNVQPGMRLQLIRRLNEQVAFEAIYFGLQSWSAGNTLYVDPFGSNTVAYSPYTQTDALIGGFGTSLGYVNRSSINNVEFNQLFKRVDFGNWRWSTLWGVRYLLLSDRLDITGLDNYYPAYENVNLNSTNNLLGLQVGTAWQRDWNRLHLQLNGKAGLMANIIHLHETNMNSSGVYGSPSGFYPYDVSANRGSVAGVFDLSAVATYNVSTNFLVRLGYQLLFVPGVALAPDQLDGVVRQDSIFLHGPMAGCELRW